MGRHLLGQRLSPRTELPGYRYDGHPQPPLPGLCVDQDHTGKNRFGQAISMSLICWIDTLMVILYTHDQFHQPIAIRMVFKLKRINRNLQYTAAKENTVTDG
jgi:hypothetical protein